MLEIATSLAVEKLKQEMSSEDNERIVEEFSDSLLSSAGSLFA